jgi:hypothetical protein
MAVSLSHESYWITVQLALKSGTVTPKRGFTAYPEGFEAEFMDKPSP